MIDATFVSKFADLIRNRKPEVVDVHGHKRLYLPNGPDNWTEAGDVENPERLPSAVELATLEGLVAFLRSTEEPGDLVHVVNPFEVRLLGDLVGPFKQRAIYAAVHSRSLDPRFGRYQSPEDFVVWLMTGFVDSPARAEVLRLVGNLRDEAVRTVADDGVTQMVTARAGIALSNEVRVPNPVVLAPYRTFREIEQPPSPFLLRLRRGGEKELPTCALMEADGGAWELAAIESIRAWLTSKLQGVGVAIVA